ncbi:MAG TPA: glycosyltransferase [Frankiaceae bacterium]|nr:glycosyltransferase [Frankiaceae bacterium]
MDVEILPHPSGAGVAENRAFLLGQARAPYVLVLDDDIVLEPESLARMLDAMGRLRVGSVAMATTGLSFVRARARARVKPVDDCAHAGVSGITSYSTGTKLTL